MTPSDTLMELLLQVYDEMDGSEREAWSMTDAENWLRDQRRYEMEHNLPPIECNSQMVYDIVRDFIHAYSGEEATAPETEYQRLIAAETIAETIEIRERATGKTGVANSTQDGCVAVFYGSPDGSDDAVLSPEAFSERFEITAIIND